MTASQIRAELKARLRDIQVFGTDVDNCVILSEKEAGVRGVIPAMDGFQRQVCQLELPPGMLRCWKTGEVVGYDQFLVYQPGNSMIDMLQGVAKWCNLNVTPEQLTFWNIQESLFVCDAFAQHMEPTPGASNLLMAAKSVNRFRLSAISSSVLRRLEVSLNTAGLLSYYDTVYSAQSQGWVRNGTPTTFDIWEPPAHFRSVAQFRGEERPKPRPDVYELACELEGVCKCELSTIEDSRSGVVSAKTAGIGLILGYTGSVPESDRPKLATALTAAGADFVFEDLSEIADAISELA